MSRLDPRQGLMPSILDRLTDADAAGTAWRHGYDLQRIIDAVRRDLEELLNSHQVYSERLENSPQTSKSILSYGLPDFSSYGDGTQSRRQEIAGQVEEIINRFEPRLRNVKAI